MVVYHIVVRSQEVIYDSPEKELEDQEILMPDYEVADIGGVYELSYEEHQDRKSFIEEITASECVKQIGIHLLSLNQVQEEAGMAAGEEGEPSTTATPTPGNSTCPDEDLDGECDDDDVDPVDEESLIAGKTPYERSFINRHRGIFLSH